MPTYEFRCPEGHEFEKFFPRISDAASELECPECGKIAERRISGGAGFLFKGSGFYLTDYGRNAHRKSAPDKKESGTKDSGSKEKKSESKPGGGGDGGSSSGGMKASEGGGTSTSGSKPGSGSNPST